MRVVSESSTTSTGRFAGRRIDVARLAALRGGDEAIRDRAPAAGCRRRRATRRPRSRRRSCAAGNGRTHDPRGARAGGRPRSPPCHPLRQPRRRPSSVARPRLPAQRRVERQKRNRLVLVQDRGTGSGEGDVVPAQATRCSGPPRAGSRPPPHGRRLRRSAHPATTSDGGTTSSNVVPARRAVGIGPRRRAAPTASRTTSRPTPRPDMLGHRLRRADAAAQQQADEVFAASMSFAGRRRSAPRCAAARRTASRSMPRPSSRQAKTMRRSAPDDLDRDLPGRRLAGARRARRSVRSRARRRCERSGPARPERVSSTWASSRTSPPVPSKATCLPSARAASRAVRSSAVNTLSDRHQPQAARRPRAPGAARGPSARRPSRGCARRRRPSGAARRRSRDRWLACAAERRAQSVATAARTAPPADPRDAATCSTPWRRRRSAVQQRVRLRRRRRAARRPRRRRLARCASARRCRLVAPRPARTVASAGSPARRWPPISSRCCKHRIDLARGRDAVGRIAQRRQRVLDRVRPIGDLGLLDDARRALERVRQAQQPLDRARRRPRPSRARGRRCASCSSSSRASGRKYL